MGQKVHPIGFRLGITTQHSSNWYAEKSQYTENLLKDIEVREHLSKKLAHASVSRIEIERTADNARVLIHTARPGIVIGKKGEDIDKMREDITKRMGIPVTLSIQEIRKPDLDVMFRRAMKRAVQNCMRQGAQGVKIRVAGRLGGAEIARAEIQKEGRVPLHTLRADIDYGLAEANTTYGVIGVKAWVFKGEVLAPSTKEGSE
jgi:small subunit ribosomal protein S3